MSKYLFLFRGGMNLQAASPEQIQANMMKWKVWMDELTQQGKMLAGEPLDRPGRTLSGKGRKVTDGPFAEGKELVGGFMTVEAANFDEAVEIGKGCPIFEHEGSVEVRPVMEMSV